MSMMDDTGLINSSETNIDVTISNRLNQEHWMNLTLIENENTGKLVSTIIYMGLLIIIGIIGNTLVLIVYTLRIRTGTTRIFILALALIDVLNNIFGMSGEIIDIVHTYTFTSSLMCKIIRFNNYITVFSSIYTLIAVAIDRHRKVCRPHNRQITEKGAKIMIGLAVLAAAIITIPALLLNGVHEYEYENVVVYECTFTNSVKDSIYPTILVGTQFLIFVLTMIILVGLYLMIGREIFIHSRFSFKLSSEKKLRKEVVDATKAGGKSVSFGNTLVTSIEMPADSVDEQGDSAVENSEMQSDIISDRSRQAIRYSIQVNKRRKLQKAQKIKNKTTLMLVAITVVFILSCLPYLSISVMKRLNEHFVTSLGDTGYKIYNIALRSYFINSAANPIVYSFCNARFRQEVATVIFPRRDW